MEKLKICRKTRVFIWRGEKKPLNPTIHQEGHEERLTIYMLGSCSFLFVYLWVCIVMKLDHKAPWKSPGSLGYQLPITELLGFFFCLFVSWAVVKRVVGSCGFGLRLVLATSRAVRNWNTLIIICSVRKVPAAHPGFHSKSFGKVFMTPRSHWCQQDISLELRAVWNLTEALRWQVIGWLCQFATFRLEACVPFNFN